MSTSVFENYEADVDIRNATKLKEKQKRMSTSTIHLEK